MDGDLFLLLLGLNQPEIYVMRRWQGAVVEDFVAPRYSKIDPYEAGVVYCDIQSIREGILIEMLEPFIRNDRLLANLYISEYVQNGYPSQGMLYDRVKQLAEKQVTSLHQAVRSALI